MLWLKDQTQHFKAEITILFRQLDSESLETHQIKIKNKWKTLSLVKVIVSKSPTQVCQKTTQMKSLSHKAQQPNFLMKLIKS
jgi:hypothetical protein